MDNSNWTLRFPRTAKEVYGHRVAFESRRAVARPLRWLVAAAFFLLVVGVL